MRRGKDKHRGLSPREVKRREKAEHQRVYIVTHNHYQHLNGGWGFEEIDGGYGSVEKANEVARKRMKGNLGLGGEYSSEDKYGDDYPYNSKDEYEVDPPSESFDKEGCVTLIAEEFEEQWLMCSVSSYKLG